MITRTTIILFSLCVVTSLGCSKSGTTTSEAPPAVQGTPSLTRDLKSKAKEIAIRELEKWVKGTVVDSEQIAGATVSTVTKEGNLIHITMMKDVSARDNDGRVQPEGMHKVYFHVFLDQNFRVVKVERGPDEMS